MNLLVRSPIKFRAKKYGLNDFIVELGYIVIQLLKQQLNLLPINWNHFNEQ